MRLKVSNSIRVVGLDPSLRNWGIAIADLTPSSPIAVQVSGLQVVCPLLPTGKQTRQNSRDIESAKQLTEATLTAIKDAQAIFVEVPIGSQSARAMASYGVCVGVLGAIKGMGIPLFEVTPNEVKLISVGDKLATKKDMITWATSSHPEAPWPYRTLKGERIIIDSKAEHMADAIATIYAGVASAPFQQLLPFITKSLERA